MILDNKIDQIKCPGYEKSHFHSVVQQISMHHNSHLTWYLEQSQHGLRARPDILASIYGRVPGLRLRFQNPEKLSEGEETHVRPTCGSRFSCYRVMVNYQVVLSGQNASIVSQAGAKCLPSSRDCYPLSVLRSYPVCCSRIVVHALLILSLVIDMRTLLSGLNNERGTQSLRLEQPLT